jgi:hypothetical protein
LAERGCCHRGGEASQEMTAAEDHGVEFTSTVAETAIAVAG